MVVAALTPLLVALGLLVILRLPAATAMPLRLVLAAAAMLGANGRCFGRRGAIIRFTLGPMVYYCLAAGMLALLVTAAL
jgi:L-lactate permease